MWTSTLYTHTNTTRYSTIKNEIKHSQSSAALTDCVLSTRLHPVRNAFSFYCTLQYRNLPRGGSGDLIIVVLSQDLEQLVEEHWQEADDHWDPLHAQKTLEKDETGKQEGGRGGMERARKREEEGGGRGEEKKNTSNGRQWVECSLASVGLPGRRQQLVSIPVTGNG